MKNTFCDHYRNFSRQDRRVYAYEKQTEAVADAFKPKEGGEKLQTFAEIREQVFNKMTDAKNAELDSIRRAHNAARAQEANELSAPDHATPKGKKEYDEKKKKFEGNNAQRLNDLKAAEAVFNEDATKALDKLKKALDEAHEKRKTAAEDFAKSTTKGLMDAESEVRNNNAGKDVEHYMRQQYLTMQDKVAMPLFKKTNDGPLVNAGGPVWNGEQVRFATQEMLKAIYVEQGPKVAEAKAKALAEASKTTDGKVNYFSLQKTFGDNNRGGFSYVLDTMHFDTNKGPEAFGKVVGYMNSAHELFKGENERYFAQYEAALKQAIANGKEYPSPSTWAKENVPEVFAQPKEAGSFVDRLLESYLPQPPQDYEYYRTNPNLPAPTKKACAEYEAKIAQKARTRTLLLAVLTAEPDSSKWDALAKQALTTMLGGTFDAKKIGEADPGKIIQGRELYGDAGKKLDDESKVYISGLIAGAEFAYGGKTYKAVDGGKIVEKDFVTHYKEIVQGVLKNNSTLLGEIKDLKGEMRDAIEASREKNADKLLPTEKARIETEYRTKVYALIQKEVPTAKKAWDAVMKDAPKAPEQPTAPVQAVARAPRAPVKTLAAPATVAAANPVAPTAKPAAKETPTAEPVVAEAKAETPELSSQNKTELKQALEGTIASPRPKEGFTAKFLTDELEKNLQALSGIPEQDYTSKDAGLKVHITPKEGGGYDAKIIAATPELKTRFKLDKAVAELETPPTTRVAKNKVATQTEEV